MLTDLDGLKSIESTQVVRPAALLEVRALCLRHATDTQQPLLLLGCCAGQGPEHQDQGQGWQEGARGGWQINLVWCESSPACCVRASAHQTAEASRSASMT